MSKKFEPLNLDKETKLSYVSNPQTTIKPLQMSNQVKDFQKKNSEKLTNFTQNKVSFQKNPFIIENKQKKIKSEKIQNENININNQQIDFSAQENVPQNQLIEINDLIGEKCDLDLEILTIPFNNFEQSKISSKTMGIIHAYGANTYQGLVRNYNEDRVSIIINMNKPHNYKKNYWPKTSFFGIYDGHGGSKCADYLRDCLHKLIFNDENFPENVKEAIKNGFLKAENEFLNNYALDKDDNMNILDRSGSCAVIIIIVDKKIYIANVGDSRAILSLNLGSEYIIVTEDHKPSNEKEKIRIINNGGQVYQTQTPINGEEGDILNGQILLGPYRVLPGRLSVSRTIGDIEAKGIQFGGNPNVVVPYPDIYSFDLKKDDIDFLVLGCDGIYDQISSEEILDCAWMIFRNKEINYNLHEKCGIIVDFILKASMARKSFDNVTCVIVALKDNLEIRKNYYHNSNVSNIKKEQKKILSEINKEFKIAPPTTLSKGSYNSIMHSRQSNNIEELKNPKIKGITLNAERTKKVKKISHFNNKRKEKEISKNKLNKDKSEIGNNNINNIKKILNKSENSHQSHDIKKNESERTHSKKTFIKKIPYSRLINSHNNVEYSHSPMEQRRSDLNVLKINKISNGIRSSNNFNNKISKFHYHYDNNYKSHISSNLSSNSHKKSFATINNNNNINNLKEKKSNLSNKSDLSYDTLAKNSLRNNRPKFTEIKKSKNRNEYKMRLQNHSGISSFRNNLPKEEHSNPKTTHQNISNTSEKIRQSNSSKRKQSYQQILNNLNFHFHFQKQKTYKNGLGQMKKKQFVQTQRLIDKKISQNKGEELEMFLRKGLNNFHYQKNKKLKLDIKNSNMNIKKIKSGKKYINSVGNNITSYNPKNGIIINKYHNITQKNSNPKYSNSSLNSNSIRQGNNKLSFHYYL